jgi:hypothetical protein
LKKSLIRLDDKKIFLDNNYFFDPKIDAMIKNLFIHEANLLLPSARSYSHQPAPAIQSHRRPSPIYLLVFGKLVSKFPGI